MIAEEPMRHYSQTEWIDFVRNAVPAELRVSMQEHLDQGCGNCLKIAYTWAAVVEFAGRERFYEPPAGAVRKAESYFTPFILTRRESTGVRILQHVFDSFELSALGGIRSSNRSVPRQLMYNSGSMVVDLRVERKSSSNSIALTGQLVDAQVPEGVLEEIPVLLFSNGYAPVETTTNDCGEFNLSFKAAEHPGLLLRMKDVDLLLLLPEQLAGGSIN
jgi:hypothetical protein